MEAALGEGNGPSDVKELQPGCVVEVETEDPDNPRTIWFENHRKCEDGPKGGGWHLGGGWTGKVYYFKVPPKLESLVNSEILQQGPQ